MTFLGGLYLAAFGDKNVCVGWAGMWAEHDCMTFVGFDDGGRAQFCFFLQTVYFTWLFWMHVMCTILRPQGGTLNASSHQNLSLAVRFMDKEASVGEIACTEMAQNYTHRLCVVESELFS